MSINVSKVSKETIRQFSPFISYSHSDQKLFDEIVNGLKGQYFLSDKLINKSSEDYSYEIQRMINKCTCGIVILGERLSSWVLYEVGLLHGFKKNIYIYNSLNIEIPTMLKGYEVINDLEGVKKAIKESQVFNDIMQKSTITLSREDFNKAILPKLGYVELDLFIPGLRQLNPASYEFNILIPHFYLKHHNGVKINPDICYKTGDDLEDCECNVCDKCPYTKDIIKDRGIAFFNLNRSYQSYEINGETVRYLIPVHNEVGVVFKCYVDVYDYASREKLMELLKSNPNDFKDVSYSGSGSNDRIYFMIAGNKKKGLFEVQTLGGFMNNYLCPGSIEE